MTNKDQKKEKFNKPLLIDEAIKILPTVSTTKFVGSVNLDIVLNLKEKQKKESIRGNVTLPYSLGEEKKVIVLCEEKDVNEALKAGAIKAGLTSVIDELMNGFNEFDIVIATPNVMSQLIKLGKVLGPKGLMPNPKNGTITSDVSKTVESFRAGKMNFKATQDQGVIRLKVAKLNMKPEEIKTNILALLKAVFLETKKFASNPFKKITLSPTMGTGLKLDVNDIIKNI